MRKIMQKLSRYRYLFLSLLLIASTLLLDVVSKILVNCYIEENTERIVVIPYLFSFTHYHNTGAAFSFGANNPNAIYVFIALTAVCMAAIAFAIFKWGRRSPLLLVSLSLIFSGAMGNWIDRVGKGYVDDFINFEFWKSFATFNVADMCVFFGAVCFVIYMLFFEERAARREKETKADSLQEEEKPSSGEDGAQ